MFLHPYEPIENIEFDYVIIDLNLNADYLSDLKDNLISLAPNFANKVQHSFPYLLRLNNVNKNLLDEIFLSDKEKINQGLYPFLLFIFKSYPVSEPDLVNYLKNNLVYDLSKKKYLYRFYDPKVWFFLNYFKSSDFIKINKYFKVINFFYFEKYVFFKNITVGSNFGVVDVELIEKITICNNVLNMLNENYEFDDYLIKVSKIFEYIDFIKKDNIKDRKDIIAIIFHVLLLGEEYLNTNLFKKNKFSAKGYERQSKELQVKEWNVFFDEYNFFDKRLRNKVIYDY